MKTNQSKTNSELQEGWAWLMKAWVHEKKLAKESGDWTQYIWFLKELQKQFSKLYAGFTNEKWIALFDDMFKTVSCELKESVIKSNNKDMPEVKKKKTIQEMTDEELVKAYLLGTQWLRDREQISGTNKNKLGDTYNDTEWQTGLNRIEKLENEMSKRGVAI